jgi:serine/threonine-protein kinase
VAREDVRNRELAEQRVGALLRGKWRLDRLLDTGGMASVFAATHRNGSRVAIKLLHASLSQQTDVRSRFLREGYVANKVGHPGAVNVLDDDEAEDGAVFLVMELLEGESLDARLRREGRVLVAEALRIADGVLDVLAAAHAQGIVHRDVKPGNVFLTRDRKVKVLDFGLARVREATGFQQKLTRDGVVMGTVNYMAPEQARGKSDQIDARTDLFAVGATIFTAVSGLHVHEGATAMDRMIAAASIPVRSLREVAPHVPPNVVAIVDRALAYRRDDRWPNAATMQGALQAARIAIHEPTRSSTSSVTTAPAGSTPPPLTRSLPPPPRLPPLSTRASRPPASRPPASRPPPLPRSREVEPVEISFDPSVQSEAPADAGLSFIDQTSRPSPATPAEEPSSLQISESMLETPEGRDPRSAKRAPRRGR